MELRARRWWILAEDAQERWKFNVLVTSVGREGLSSTVFTIEPTCDLTNGQWCCQDGLMIPFCQLVEFDFCVESTTSQRTMS